MLSLENISKTYHGRRALESFSLEVADGSIFALVGPNGSGKTTLLKIILGLVPADPGGSVRLDGARQDPAEYRRRIVYMPQTPAFPPHLRVSEIIRLVRELRGAPAPRLERIRADLEMTTFWERPFRELSGGMKQKVNILQAFMFDFRVAVLDEPTASLDPGIAHYLKDLLREVGTGGRSILFTTHIMHEVEEIATGMALLVEGRLELLTEPLAFRERKGAATLSDALLEYWRGSRDETEHKH